MNPADQAEDCIQTIMDTIKTLRALKERHPELKCTFYHHSHGSLLNAYREGDISFDECVRLLKAIPPERCDAD